MYSYHLQKVFSLRESLCSTVTNTIQNIIASPKHVFELIICFGGFRAFLALSYASFNQRRGRARFAVASLWLVTYNAELSDSRPGWRPFTNWREWSLELEEAFIRHCHAVWYINLVYFHTYVEYTLATPWKQLLLSKSNIFGLKNNNNIMACT